MDDKEFEMRFSGLKALHDRMHDEFLDLSDTSNGLTELQQERLAQFAELVHLND